MTKNPSFDTHCENRCLSSNDVPAVLELTTHESNAVVQLTRRQFMFNQVIESRHDQELDVVWRRCAESIRGFGTITPAIIFMGTKMSRSIRFSTELAVILEKYYVKRLFFSVE